MSSVRRRSERSSMDTGVPSCRRPAVRTEREAGARTHGFVFKVALKKGSGIWRRIAMRGDRSLHHLHEAIFAAFDREEDHLCSFYFPKPGARGRDRLRGAVEYTHPEVAEPAPFGEASTDASKARLDRLRLQVGQKFEYLFDFGDSWWHEITVEGVAVPLAGGRSVTLLERHGASLPQYPEAESPD